MASQKLTNCCNWRFLLSHSLFGFLAKSSFFLIGTNLPLGQFPLR
jgi:hypothetical protein